MDSHSDNSIDQNGGGLFSKKKTVAQQQAHNLKKDTYADDAYKFENKRQQADNTKQIQKLHRQYGNNPTTLQQTNLAHLSIDQGALQRQAQLTPAATERTNQNAQLQTQHTNLQRTLEEERRSAQNNNNHFKNMMSQSVEKKKSHCNKIRQRYTEDVQYCNNTQQGGSSYYDKYMKYKNKYISLKYDNN
jgi:hypothetical protein